MIDPCCAIQNPSLKPAKVTSFNSSTKKMGSTQENRNQTHSKAERTLTFVRQ